MPIVGSLAGASIRGFGGLSVPPVVLRTFDAIATYTAASTPSTITFSSIPQTYKHLQIRAVLRNTGASNYATISINSGSVRQNWFSSTAGTVSVTMTTSSDIVLSNISTAPTTYYGGNILDIEDYASTTRNKSVRNIGGFQTTQTTTGGVFAFASLLSVNTGAVTSITLTPGAGNFAQYSSATLYGWA